MVDKKSSDLFFDEIMITVFVFSSKGITR